MAQDSRFSIAILGIQSAEMFKTLLCLIEKRNSIRGCVLPLVGWSIHWLVRPLVSPSVGMSVGLMVCGYIAWVYFLANFKIDD